MWFMLTYVRVMANTSEKRVLISHSYHAYTIHLRESVISQLIWFISV